MSENTVNAPPAIERARRIVMLSFYSLLAIFTAYALVQFIREGNLAAVVFLWLFKVLPLSIFIFGLHKRHLRTYAWLSFVALLYFVVGVQTAFVEASRVYGILVSVNLSILFCALVSYIRSYRNFYKVSL
ncbi:MAG: DUF2069 domain-containing protein [Pseudohongiellaceae bacterium]|nr:DUF2069 domain-containing protein [Pseudohongiellaceae bacterium]